MKTLILLIVIVAATIQSASAQEENKTKYSFGLSQFNSGSGFQGGYEMQVQIQPNAKAKVGFGLFMDRESGKLSGLTVTHQRMLMSGRVRAPKLQPYIFYNFIYRKTNIPELMGTEMSATPEIVTYTSMEHHLGIGLQAKVTKLVSLHGGLAYGIYLGSIKRPSAPNPITQEITGTNGGAVLAKFGIAINI